MKIRIAVLIAIMLGVTSSAIAEMLHPWPREFWSTNRQFCIVVTPPEKLEHAGNCRAVMFEVKGTNKVERWARFVPNNLSPSYMFISDTAEFILSVGDWSESSHTLPVVVYRKNWLMRAHTLESLGVESQGNMVDPFNWLDGAKVFFGPEQKTFVIVLKTGHPIVIEEAGDVWGPTSSNQAERDSVLSFITKHKDSAKTMLQYMEEASTSHGTALPCQHVKPNISVTLHAPTVPRMISDVSARDLPPQRSVRQNADGTFTKIEPTDEEIESWKKKFAAPVDLVVEIENTSTRELRFFEEWNSWGYCNLKFAFGDSFHEYWVTKIPGLWYRNFSSFHTLRPGESFQIPVAFAAHIWSGLDQVETNAPAIIYVRALYEQYQTPMFGGAEGVWRGAASSPFYPAAALLPRFGFRTSEWMPDQENEIDQTNAPLGDFSDPDDIKIEIEDI